MKLTDNEKRDVIKYLEAGKPLPEKYRFLLFEDDREVELLWNGKTNEVTNVVLPFQVIEQIDEPRSDARFGNQNSLFDTSGRQITGWTNKLIWGDNKLILSSLNNGPLRKEIEAQGGLKLIYIDPPFDVGADFSMDIKIGDGEDEESFTKKPSVIEEIAYRDTWGKGADSFIAMIYERLKLMYDLLTNDGSIYVHCDWRVNSYMRLVLDEIFGKDNLRNTIAWLYSGGGIPQNEMPKKYDTIFWYTKSDKWTYNAQYRPYSEGTVERGRTAIKGEDAKLREQGTPINDWWPDVKKITSPTDYEKLDYPTQKSEELLERVIKLSSNPGDLVADFFAGSGTTLAVAEKLGRKWIGSDLGKFGIHTSRKRLIGVQRELKKSGKDFRAFEILNVGRYERENFLAVNDDLRAEEKAKQAERKEKEFVKLIISAYKAEPVGSFVNIVGKKRDRLVAVGPINTPVSSKLIQDIVAECKEKGITKIDVLGFDYEMGLDFQEYREQGVDIAFRIIPREVFDKKAVEKGQVKFYDVAFIEARPCFAKATQGKQTELSIQLTDFSVFYNQDDSGEVWSDWIDYWAVDYDFASRKEIIKVIENGEEKEVWTGDYIFDNEWQSFRTKKNRNLELTSAAKEMTKGTYKVAVKVVDIFGNDTTKIIGVKI
ncbi:MAG: Site-specific DNA-methyltransferase (Adenine-specific) [Candidatus Magasanikbacteria bacterium GW2011_GWA2_42_32]|uniref:Site-specific DNA-methyltransferase (Adenine-specific) n=1 Tax=Candidatus Magasanikbacteria bacterium GW2011_GWA2_42_32 TaxID=1619039 RepID=A0A0G1C8F7_9BACT|nr:MAG: Site-specific DNA-methyltransferase (Adenine-specific) [Candidatus Magasanikbacteria bacterium GW2011_GWA2_42_32]